MKSGMALFISSNDVMGNERGVGVSDGGNIIAVNVNIINISLNRSSAVISKRKYRERHMAAIMASNKRAVKMGVLKRGVISNIGGKIWRVSFGGRRYRRKWRGGKAEKKAKISSQRNI
jgi:hypothetical protein